MGRSREKGLAVCANTVTSGTRVWNRRASAIEALEVARVAKRAVQNGEISEKTGLAAMENKDFDGEMGVGVVV